MQRKTILRTGMSYLTLQVLYVDLILRVSRKINDMFLVPTQEVTTAFVSVLFFFFVFFLIYLILIGNSETGPTIFLKLAQIEVQGYSGALSDLEENLSTSFRAMIFQK